MISSGDQRIPSPASDAHDWLVQSIEATVQGTCFETALPLRTQSRSLSWQAPFGWGFRLVPSPAVIYSNGVCHCVKTPFFQKGLQLTLDPGHDWWPQEGEGRVQLHQGGPCLDLLQGILSAAHTTNPDDGNRALGEGVHLPDRLGRQISEWLPTQSPCLRAQSTLEANRATHCGI